MGVVSCWDGLAGFGDLLDVANGEAPVFAEEAAGHSAGGGAAAQPGGSDLEYGRRLLCGEQDRGVSPAAGSPGFGAVGPGCRACPVGAGSRSTAFCLGAGDGAARWGRYRQATRRVLPIVCGPSGLDLEGS
ncbi:hypothetical protein GCM10022243_47660 [Saccharothrix violaceirubra]